ncbi:uncharacterized protein LOC133375135 [Rhineura floridana]|uniref:uncharacterized protein LOC133375135 n=1 Tax=Rhineura floridana TaxID=261503 RepID=UPI002AC80209|nr:uncharacterized protein LOC133375135 [Rhineura floridana]XP_061462668.1 uncharacterized protein LOC133375135 [Rhineura floridana]XP_061462669.1 uncharacterized protein LOC133375135 [Rhineura floridana]XP_061462670.1 uncharacterized protein LOC133375135 [Rhineura floridana]XP_061462671.1 uncharacterized protein LOC133375135 [Rhineura floridana]XP_061462672.1 uncharacterized protein LOC133375135 [Rhineura floridana]XP_061462673.1 uncharacterized protein LOC133375135 [Rhineura floridana]XP_0
MEMLVFFAEIMLLSLHRALCFPVTAARWQGNAEIPQKLAQISASPGATVSISCNIPTGSFPGKVIWYKEEHDGRLCTIKVEYLLGIKDGCQVNLTKQNLQKNDSGIYYCAALSINDFKIMSSTRLIVLGASQPRLSIFVPSTLEAADRNLSIPLLCVFFDTNPDRNTTLSWSSGGNTSQDQQHGDLIDWEGTFSIWSLKLIPPERWTHGMPYSCSDQENRNFTAVVPKNVVPVNTGNCRYILYVGLPCVLLLLLIPPSVLLLFRKRLAGAGNAGGPADQIPMRVIQQTDYAEVRCNK